MHGSLDLFIGGVRNVTSTRYPRRVPQKLPSGLPSDFPHLDLDFNAAHMSTSPLGDVYAHLKMAALFFTCFFTLKQAI